MYTNSPEVRKTLFLCEKWVIRENHLLLLLMVGKRKLSTLRKQSKSQCMFGGTKHTLSVELIQQIKKHKTFLLCADNPVASENTFLLY